MRHERHSGGRMVAMAAVVLAEPGCHGHRRRPARGWCRAPLRRRRVGVGGRRGRPQLKRRTRHPIASSPSPRQSAASASPTPSTTPVTPESPEEVAVAFVRVWARPDAADEEWQASCQALSTTRFASALDAATSAAVPASRVDGETEVLRRSDGAASVRVPTDGGAVHVALQQTPAGWRVDGIEPEELSVVTSASRG